MASLDLLPNLVVPGVAKSGTSSLFWYLSQHPDICQADKKEINYFGSIRFGPHPKASIEQYADHFSHYAGQRYRLDTSQVYFDGGRPVVEAIKRYFPDPRILIIVREPVDRVWSSFISAKHLGQLDPALDFSNYFERCRDLRRTGEDVMKQQLFYRALSTSAYVDYMHLWFDAFDDVRMVFFEHLVEDPAHVLVDICYWLDIDPEPVRGFDFSQRNKTMQPRSRRLYQIANEINMRVDRGSRLAPGTKRALRAAYRLINTSKRGERMSAPQRAAAEEYFAPLNAALRKELLARGYERFPAWLDVDTDG